MTNKKCHKCGGDTKPSKVMVTTYIGKFDLPVVSGKLTDCQKCTKCGTSIVYVKNPCSKQK